MFLQFIGAVLLGFTCSWCGGWLAIAAHSNRILGNVIGTLFAVAVILIKFYE
jgi:hypothetical protein